MLETPIYNSSMFEAVIWKGVLIVKFTSNQTIYIYPDVSDSILEGFKNADSKGKYFIENIKKTISFKKTEFMTLQDAMDSL